MKKTLLSIVLCVALLASFACVAVSAESKPTPVDGTMDFSLLPGAAADFTTQDGGEGKVTVSKNDNGSFTFKADKGWPCAYNTGAVTESDKWANVDFTKDVYLNFDFQVKSGAAKLVVYFCGQNPQDMAAVGNYFDVNAAILKNYQLAYGGTQDDVGVGMYQGSVNLKDLYVDVDMTKEAYINPDLVVEGKNGDMYSYVSGFKVFAVGGEVILNDVSIGKAKYGEPKMVYKTLNLLTNGSSNGTDGESEVTFADGTYTVKVNKGFDGTNAYGMQVMAGLKDFNLGDTTNLHFAIESDTPWRLTLRDAEIDKWFGFGANFATVVDKSGAEKSPESDTGFYPAGTYELCVDYGSIYTWNANNGAPEFDVTSASLDGIFIEAKNPGTMNISTLKLSGENKFSATAGTFTDKGASNDDVVEQDGQTGETIPAGQQGASGNTTTKNNGGAAGGNSANTGDVSDAALFIVVAAAAAAVVTLSAVSKKAKSR